MFSAKSSAPATGGLTVNTSAANSLFGSSNAQTTSSTSQPTTTSTTGSTGGLFGNLGSSTSQSKPGGGLFGSTTSGTTQGQSGQSLFSGLGSNTTSGAQQSGTTTTTTSQPQSGSLFSGLGGTSTSNTTQQQSGGSLFGNLGTSSTTQTQSKSLFGGLGSSTTGSSLFGNQNTSQQQQQQQQQQQKPTLSLFGNQNTGTSQQQQQASAATGTVVPGVKVDVSNLLPTTKFESCSDELKKQIEAIDTFILNQIHMCNEVSDLLPTIANQGATIPNDVEFVQGKLDTMQHALENDAGDIDHVRKLVSRDAAEAQVAFRAIDNLKLPLQYQSTGGGWWSVSEQQLAERQSLRSSIRNRKSTLALPDDVEADPSTVTSVNGVPVNLVDYFSHRADEMRSVLDSYKRNLKEIEDHLHGVEATLSRQINEFVASRNRDGTAGTSGAAKSQLNDLAAALSDVEAGIFGVASRLGGVKEEVQELVLGPPNGGLGRLG
ncbi:hypothetical protein VTN96DRAFT_2259 [Rasamsonia emersonii]